MSYTVNNLAEWVAALKPEDVEEFEKTLSGLRAEQSRRAEARIAELRGMTDAEVKEERLADLRSMTDEAVMELMFVRHHDNWPNPAALTLLREAGFVRGVTLEAAYREGYERGAYDIHVGAGVPNIYAVDDLDYTLRRDLWLDTQAKAAVAS